MRIDGNTRVQAAGGHGAYSVAGETAMSVITDMVARGWENFIARPSGPLNFRFILQPTMASLLAIWAGIRDARDGRPAYLWAALTDAQHRSQLLHGGWKDLRLPVLLGVSLDSAYQLIVHGFIYPIELLFTVILLVVVPYLLLRGPLNRIFALRRHEKQNTTKVP